MAITFSSTVPMHLKQSATALLFLLLPLTLSACSPAVMQGVAQGLANYNQSQYGREQSQSQQTNVCVKYQTETGWSQGYSVEASIIKGAALNQRTGTYEYNAYSTYAVVFWDRDQASILEFDYYTGSVSTYGQSATDQRGRRWNVSQSDYCY